MIISHSIYEIIIAIELKKHLWQFFYFTLDKSEIRVIIYLKKGYFKPKTDSV